MGAIKDFFRRYNDDYVVTIVEAWQKMVDLRQKRFGMLEPGGVLTNLAKIHFRTPLQKSVLHSQSAESLAADKTCGHS